MALTMVKPDEMESQVGTKLPPGDWFEVDQERINTFADCTEDHDHALIEHAHDQYADDAHAHAEREAQHADDGDDGDDGRSRRRQRREMRRRSPPGEQRMRPPRPRWPG